MNFGRRWFSETVENEKVWLKTNCKLEVHSNSNEIYSSKHGKCNLGSMVKKCNGNWKQILNIWVISNFMVIIFRPLNNNTL